MLTRVASVVARRRKCRGTSAVEFALIAPLMIAFTFGIVEIGRLSLVKQSATHATREGARVAIRPTATGGDVIEAVQKELAILAIDGAAIEVEPALVEEAAPGSLITVRVRIGIASVSWVPGFLDFGTTDLVAESSMRRESTN
ncbi:TadE/TadG family type IV pilus assembly protein [Novipirellula artificiosorum]|uniref:TadE-like protein n=1 Tax=Novipirellula artificiosorum TaxID=2528016 RepID=A0A5C6DH49_9BACT|nr:TadE family protein [Novipirellula artificiosorum]TWU34366.1 TadE-like protein [Novipirellula artificiosorum]